MSSAATAPADEARATMLAFYQRMLGGDADGANDLISRDPDLVFIGSAGEWVADQEALRAGRLEPGEGLEAGSDPQAFVRGDVAWFVDQPTWHFGDGSSVKMRLSAVLQLEPAGWRIVHVHMSMGVPDNECVALQRRWDHGIPMSVPISGR